MNGYPVVDTDQWGYIALSGIGRSCPEFRKPVLQYRKVYSKGGDGCAQKCTHLYKVALFLCTIQVYRVVRSGDHVDLQ